MQENMLTALSFLHSSVSPGQISARCPICGHLAVLETVQPYDLGIDNKIICGIRRCPRLTCRGVLFVAYTSPDEEVMLSYPSMKIDFDRTNIPDAVLSALHEAITCHAGHCYVAAAIMVRKTLEELCHDQQVTGSSLNDRLQKLSKKVTLPPDLIRGLDSLRLLGNDAAHIESQTFNEVGEEEVSLAIECAKEILKGLYQYSALIERLNARRVNPPQ